MPSSSARSWKLAAILVVAAGVAAVWMSVSLRDAVGAAAADQNQSGKGRSTAYTVARRDFIRGIRLSGTVEAIQSMTVTAPRLSGPNSASLVITRLVRAGSTVAPGDLIVEFDRQQQVQNALDRRAELQDLEQQIRKRDAQEAAAAAKDESEIKQAESAMARAQLEMVKNDMIARINAEKNKNALEQAQATLTQLNTTFQLKRRAAEADVRMLRIRRDRAENAMRMAETNAERMAIHAPIGGMAVLKTVWKSNNMAEVQEGEEIRAGVPVVDIVNPNAMRVRSRVNQADINELRVGQPVRVGLDAYPALEFTGRIAQISPLGIVSTLSPKVRSFIVLIDVQGSHPNLMPDLTASLDVELARTPAALVVPRDAVRIDGERTYVSVQRGSRLEDKEVTLGPRNAHEVVVSSGIDDGAVVARNVGARSRR
jgi:multidrug efflux pump subunit AcrA (membrane-fusion protein)